LPASKEVAVLNIRDPLIGHQDSKGSTCKVNRSCSGSGYQSNHSFPEALEEPFDAFFLRPGNGLHHHSSDSINESHDQTLAASSQSFLQTFAHSSGDFGHCTSHASNSVTKHASDSQKKTFCEFTGSLDRS
ncbi:GSCOCG00013506001-RA-CDS, partial [Cotesia congregata]